jgi:adenylate cyclase
MAEERVQRRLAAILAADVVGYSRLMGEDEVGTLSRLKTLRRELFDPKTKQYGGRVFKTTGDGAFVEFNSAVEAVKSASDIQEAIAARNVDISEDQKILLRIGISLGDVIVEGSDLYGNGVNVASRMEGLAEPGGICVSGNVHEHIGKSLDVNFEDLGEQSVKNFDRPVRCYRVHLEHTGPAKAPSPPLPDKPSIAVLPFENMSGDPEQEYFADGITEDVITALSKISKLAVIARNSTFVYKGTATDVRRIAEDLGVRYVLEGSVRSGGKRLRVSAQLIDAMDGRHVWAERYDRVAEDLFDLQDEITKEIVTALRVQLSDGEEALVWNRGTKNVEAWRSATEATELFLRFAPADIARARELSQRAIDLDPDYAHAWSVNGVCDLYMARIGPSDAVETLVDRAEQSLLKARSIDETVSWVHFGMSFLLAHRKEFDAAVDAARNAVALQPGNAEIRAGLGYAQIRAGEAEAALETLQDALRLNPYAHGWYRLLIARAFDMLGDPEKALHESQGITSDIPFGAFLNIACLQARLGRLAEAKTALKEALRLNPQFTLSAVERYLNSRDGDYVEIVKDGLRKAGLPE